MYAVTFDIDTNCLASNDVSDSKAYGEIRKFMEQHGFKWQQGSVYFGDETIIVSLRSSSLLRLCQSIFSNQDKEYGKTCAK